MVFECFLESALWLFTEKSFPEIFSEMNITDHIPTLFCFLLFVVIVFTSLWSVMFRGTFLKDPETSREVLHRLSLGKWSWPLPWLTGSLCEAPRGPRARPGRPKGTARTAQGRGPGGPRARPGRPKGTARAAQGHGPGGPRGVFL